MHHPARRVGQTATSSSWNPTKVWDRGSDLNVKRYHSACWVIAGRVKKVITTSKWIPNDCYRSFFPVLLMKTKAVKRLKNTDKKLKKCGTTAARKLHSCDLCHYRAPTIYVLRRHRLTHTGVKPFECTLCLYKAYQKSALITHHLTHTGEKPFQCTI